MCLIGRTFLYNIYFRVFFSKIIFLPELSVVSRESWLDSGLSFTFHIADISVVIAEVQEKFDEKEMSTKNVNIVCTG